MQRQAKNMRKKQQCKRSGKKSFSFEAYVITYTHDTRFFFYLLLHFKQLNFFCCCCCCCFKSICFALNSWFHFMISHLIHFIYLCVNFWLPMSVRAGLCTCVCLCVLLFLCVFSLLFCFRDKNMYIPASRFPWYNWRAFVCSEGKVSGWVCSAHETELWNDTAVYDSNQMKSVKTMVTKNWSTERGVAAGKLAINLNKKV